MKVSRSLVISILFLASMLAGCSLERLQPTCESANQSYVKSIDDIRNSWENEISMLESTGWDWSKTNSLIEIREDFEEIEPPECAGGAHFLLQLYMDLHFAKILQVPRDSLNNLSTFSAYNDPDIRSAQSLFEKAWDEQVVNGSP